MSRRIHRIGLDACVFIKAHKPDTDKDFDPEAKFIVDYYKDNNGSIFLSTIILTELIWLDWKERGKPEHISIIRKYLSNKPFVLVDVTPAIGERVQQERSKKPSLRPIDFIHVITACSVDADYFITDDGFSNDACAVKQEKKILTHNKEFTLFRDTSRKLEIVSTSEYATILRNMIPEGQSTSREEDGGNSQSTLFEIEGEDDEENS